MQFQKFSYKTGDKYVSKDFPILTLHNKHYIKKQQ